MYIINTCIHNYVTYKSMIRFDIWIHALLYIWYFIVKVVKQYIMMVQLVRTCSFLWVCALNYISVSVCCNKTYSQLVRADIFFDFATICKIVLISQMATKAVVCLTVRMQHVQQKWLVCKTRILAFM